MLTADELRKILIYSPITGRFWWRVNVSQRASRGDVAGWNTKAGRQIWIRGKPYLAHRLAWLYMCGEWPRQQIDHANGYRLDNRWANLRDINGFLNQQNRKRATSRSKTGMLGVVVSRDRYAAHIETRGLRTYLGTYDTPEEAHDAYMTAKRVIHPGYVA